MNKGDIISLVLWSITMIAFGVLGMAIYEDIKNERVLNGVYLYNSENEAEARQRVQEMDTRGDWVCINVAYNMGYREAYDTCVHECSHMSFTEIYAEKCEDDPIKCMGYLE